MKAFTLAVLACGFFGVAGPAAAQSIDARRLPEIAAELREVADVTREDTMAILCAVGDGLQRDPAFVSELLQSLGGIPIRMVSQAAARRNITLVIREADLELALGRIHDRFFGVPA